MEFPIYLAEIDTNLASDLEVDFIGLVERPAIERHFMAFNDAPKRVAFTLNEEKRIISGPAMIADMPIYRNDNKLGEYFVVFGKESIQCIVEKFSAKGYLKNFNLFHNVQQKVSDVTIFNSFISNKELGIPPMAGFEDVADGSWFISAKVNNDDVWQKVKNGVIKGFSVEGMFSYAPLGTSLKMSSNYYTESDIFFLQDMICNHQDALQMAVLIDSTSSLYDFAQNIIKVQTGEIEEMKKWLANTAAGIVTNMAEDRAVRKIKRILSETNI